MSNKVVPNVRTFGRFDILGFLDDSLDSGGSGDEANKQPQAKQKLEKEAKPSGGQSSSSKKRAKKKKKQQQAESAELRNMAFSKIASVPRARTQSNGSDGGTVGSLSNITIDEQSMARQAEAGGANAKKLERRPEQWEQWKIQDQGFVDNQYEQDLQKAILQSKLEFEQQKLFFDEIKETSSRQDIPPAHAPSSPHKQHQLPLHHQQQQQQQQQHQQQPQHSHLQPGHKPVSLYQRMDQLEEFDSMPEEPEPPTPPPPSSQNPPSASSKKEKKKHSQGKHKPHAMSLQEFQTGGSGENGTPGVEPVNLLKKSPSISEEDKHFFEKVDQDVAKILNKDQIKKARKQNEKLVAENARRVQYEDQLEQKDKVISGLKDIVEKLKSELTQVKKRNKQLCFILAQGEMKDKADVLKQVEDLTSVKDELTAEVAELCASLEQERSKVSSLKSELQKLQERKK